VQVLIDGSDSNTATIAQGYALAIVNQYVATRRSAGPTATGPPPISIASRVWYNPELKSVNFIVPGVIAVIMMIVGIRMWQTTGKAQKCGTFNAARCLSIGFAVGLLTGFLGIGGGFLIVPALVLFAGLDSRMAAGTSLAVIVLNSVTGIIGHLRFESFDWRLLGGFLMFALGGMVLGTMVANSLAEYRLRRLFACTVLILAVGVGVVNLLP